ncbi:MlaA family lipoprotein [Thiomicrorhabdus arctica]|uniref:MlaA family lipoprotein n=1 Tax=Thiomicrorhabdus arctica TaxID=131540 RepID=UPI0003693F10|nr:VacJ family lipoprotein [Thiomicrorhabdus arctica]
MILKKTLPILLLNILWISPSIQADEITNDPKTQLPPMSLEDPYEAFNRPVFNFNMKFNDTVGEPLANAYNGILPQPVRMGIDNVFSNLAVPLSAINSFLQGKVEDGLSGIMRFTINSTFGLFGLLDIATPAGLEAKKEDLGQTFYHWGLWNETHYLVLPFVGSYTLRELVGSAVDSTYDPVYPYVIDTDLNGRTMIFIGGKFVDYSKIAGLIADLKNQPDPYVFSRESYMQYRTNLIYDGKAPKANLDDFNFD